MTGQTLALLLWALGAVESGWDASKDDAPCGGVGILQITPIMVEDVNIIVGEERWTLDDRYSIEKSYEMAGVYFERYCSDMSPFGAARCWQGGPDGWTEENTEEQAIRVCNLMWDAGR